MTADPQPLLQASTDLVKLGHLHPLNTLTLECLTHHISDTGSFSHAELQMQWGWTPAFFIFVPPGPVTTDQQIS